MHFILILWWIPVTMKFTSGRLRKQKSHLITQMIQDIDFNASFEPFRTGYVTKSSDMGNNYNGKQWSVFEVLSKNVKLCEVKDFLSNSLIKRSNRFSVHKLAISKTLIRLFRGLFERVVVTRFRDIAVCK